MWYVIEFIATAIISWRIGVSMTISYMKSELVKQLEEEKRKKDKLVKKTFQERISEFYKINN